MWSREKPIIKIGKCKTLEGVDQIDGDAKEGASCCWNISFRCLPTDSLQ